MIDFTTLEKEQSSLSIILTSHKKCKKVGFQFLKKNVQTYKYVSYFRYINIYTF